MSDRSEPEMSAERAPAVCELTPGGDPADVSAFGTAYPREAVTGVILAGGRARRMGGKDKGLVRVSGRPMIAYLVSVLRPQVGRLLINANRNLDAYGRFDCPVIPDLSGGYLGPLVGMASALKTADTEYVLTVPCDSPLLCADLGQILFRALLDQRADISVAHDGQRLQPVFALLRRDLLTSMLAYIDSGGRKIDTWYAQHKTAIADFSAFPNVFLNVNTPEDRLVVERMLGSRTP